MCGCADLTSRYYRGGQAEHVTLRWDTYRECLLRPVFFAAILVHRFWLIELAVLFLAKGITEESRRVFYIVMLTVDTYGTVIRTFSLGVVH